FCWFVTRACLIFFFQAEDGIRDATVTGVQTCALPISRVPQQDERAPGMLIYAHDPHFFLIQVVLLAGAAGLQLFRGRLPQLAEALVKMPEEFIVWCHRASPLSIDNTSSLSF